MSRPYALPTGQLQGEVDRRIAGPKYEYHQMRRRAELSPLSLRWMAAAGNLQRIAGKVGAVDWTFAGLLVASALLAILSAIGAGTIAAMVIGHVR